MGYIRHRAAIAIVWDDDKKAIEAVEGVRERMRKIGNDRPGGVPDCILGPCKDINGYVTYFFAPDGSKVGWSTSEECECFRNEFIGAAKLARYPNIVEMQMGGDDGETKILFTTDTVQETAG